MEKDIDNALKSAAIIVNQANKIGDYYLKNMDWESSFVYYLSIVEQIIGKLCKEMRDDGYNFNFSFSKRNPFYEVKKIVGREYIASKCGISKEYFKKFEYAHKELCHDPYDANILSNLHILGKFYNCLVLAEEICLNFEINYEINFNLSHESKLFDQIKEIELSFRKTLFLFFGEDQNIIVNKLKKLYDSENIKSWLRKSSKSNSVFNGTTFHELIYIFLDKRNFLEFEKVIHYKEIKEHQTFLNYKRHLFHILEDVTNVSNKIRHWNNVSKIQIEAINFYNIYLIFIFNKINMAIYLRLINKDLDS